MQFDMMVGNQTWSDTAQLAQTLQAQGFGGMLFTEAGTTPWMQITAAATAAPQLNFSTGIAVAFPRSPMISAQVAWEMAQNTNGRFRLGLGSQVKGHVERRYSARFDRPAPQMRDYVRAVQACLRAFRGEEKLSHGGPYYQLNYLPAQWAPPRHAHEADVKIDISAVGPHMCRLAGELCDGVHVHPVHSLHYIEHRLLPELAAGAARSGRAVEEVDLMVPVFMVPGDSPEERAWLVQRAKTQIGFYGSTPNYAFQFEDLGYHGTTARLGELMRAGDVQGMTDTITDEMLAQFAVVARWDDLADALITRYQGVASRVVSYLMAADLQRHPQHMPRWGEVARAVQSVS